MGADEPVCPTCGKPLVGRERFEGKCAACREREVLGAASPDEDGGADSAQTILCPACGAENPVGLEHCMACEARLRPRRALRLAVWSLGAAAVVAVLVVGALVGPWMGEASEPPAPQRVRRPALATAQPAQPGQEPRTAAPAPMPSRPRLVPRVREETRVLIGLLRQRAYGRVIDYYCQPDETDFPRVQRRLEAILDGDARAGLARWTARVTQLDEQMAREELAEAGAAHPGYAAALLSHLARDPSVSGGHQTAENRARALLAWHLAGLYEGLDLAHAEVMDVEDRGSGPFVVTLACPGSASQPRPGDDPRRVLWERQPVGWVLKLALADRLREVHALLERPVP